MWHDVVYISYVHIYIHSHLCAHHCLYAHHCNQEQVEKMKKEQEHLEKQLSETQAENRRLAEPLQKVSHWLFHILSAHDVCSWTIILPVMQSREEVAELQKRLSNYERDKVSLQARHIIIIHMYSVCTCIHTCLYGGTHRHKTSHMLACMEGTTDWNIIHDVPVMLDIGVYGGKNPGNYPCTIVPTNYLVIDIHVFLSQQGTIIQCSCARTGVLLGSC